MYTKTIAAAFFSLFLLMGMMPQSAQSQVNSGNVGLILHGSVGTGASMFGVINEADESSSLGAGQGNSFHAGAMVNISFFAVHSQLYYASLSDMEWDEEFAGTEVKHKTEGTGHFLTWDGTLGIKAFTEEGDMGYTHLFAGFRIWRAVRDEDKRTINGVEFPPEPKVELTGHGLIAGIRDLSTLPLGPVSLAFQTGVWVYRAPLNTYKLAGNEISITADQNIGFGFELGGGLAFEDIGLSALIGLRMDVQATAITIEPINADAVAGAGYAQFFLSVSKEF